MTSQTISADFAKISNFTKLITEIHNCSRFMADDILRSEIHRFRKCSINSIRFVVNGFENLNV